MREQTSIGMRSYPDEYLDQDRGSRSMMRGDWEGETRSSSSTTRYTRAVDRSTPRSIVRVTRHEGPPPIQRASRMRSSSEPHTNVPHLPRGRQKKSNWGVRWLAGRSFLFYLGTGVTLLFIGGILINALVNWVHVALDDVHYGRPRTFQTDLDVGHGGMSHFTVVNLHGHVLVTEIPLTDPAKTKVFGAPVITGEGADLIPATVAFEDSNGDGMSDMVLMVGNIKYVFLNSKEGFRVDKDGTS